MKLSAIPFFLTVLALSAASQIPAPTPPGDKPEPVVTEEIVLNVAAFDRSGGIATGLQRDDLVINEDGRLHQAKSLRKIPASVLIALDTGGDIRQKKNISTTRKAALKLIETLNADCKIALMQFHDRVEYLSEWTDDRAELARIAENRTNFGRRASFSPAVMSAISFLTSAPTENRHLILITDGLDSTTDPKDRIEVLRRAWSSGITVHILSYTQIEFEALKPQARIWRGGEPNPRRIPDEVKEAMISALPMSRYEAEELLKQVYPPRLLSLITDTPFTDSRRARLRALTISHLQLSALAEYSGGVTILPESLDDLVEAAGLISRAINAQYIVTYEPKRPLNEVVSNEVRQINVTSRNSSFIIEGTRRLMILAEDPK